jgi:hypothetical protein
MKKLLLALCLLGCAKFATAQGIINIVQDAELEAALQRHKELNRATTELKGWCVMLTTSTDRAKVTDLKAAFVRDFPDIPIEWTYERPYFKLQAGAYENKREAHGLLENLKNQYPGAYLARGSFSTRSML